MRLRALLPLFLLLLLAWSPPAARGQDRPSLQEIELEYQAALRTFEAAVAAREAANSRFNRAANVFSEAKASGNTERTNAAFSDFLRASEELQRLDSRVEETRERMRAAGESLLLALDRRREELLAQTDSLEPSRRAERRELAFLLLDLTNRVREVESAVTEADDSSLPGLPEVPVDERDGPEELRIKAQFLETRAEQYDSLLTDIDRRIEGLQSRQRTDRRVREFVAGLERFDDLRLPVVAQGRRGDPPAGGGEEPSPEVADSTGLAPREVTLEDRIESLLNLKDRLETYRNAALSRAGVLRELLRSGGGLELEERPA